MEGEEVVATSGRLVFLEALERRIELVVQIGQNRRVKGQHLVVQRPDAKEQLPALWPDRRTPFTKRRQFLDDVEFSIA